MATRSQTRKKEEAKPKKEGYFSRLRRQQLEAQTKIKKDSDKKKERKKKTAAEIKANKKLAEGIKKGVIDRRTVGEKSKTTAKKAVKKSRSSNTDSAYSSPSTTTMKKKDPETGIEREYQPRPGGKGFRNFNLKKEESKKMENRRRRGRQRLLPLLCLASCSFET